MKSIKKTLIVALCGLVACICLGLGLSSYHAANKAMTTTIDTNVAKIAEETANVLTKFVDGKLDTLQAIAARDDIRNPVYSIESKMEILNEEIQRLNSFRMGIVDLDGNVQNSNGTTANVSERAYFKKALQGISSVSDPVVSNVDGSLIIVYAVPIIYQEEVVGVLIETFDGTTLSTLINENAYGETGTAFIVNSAGTVVGNNTLDMVEEQTNILETAKEDSSYQSLAEIVTVMVSGTIGTGTYEYEGQEKYVGYAPIEGYDWYLGVAITKSEVLAELSGLKYSVVVLSIFFIFGGMIISYYLSHSIATKVKATAEHMKGMSEKDLSHPVADKHLKLKNEFGEMARSMNDMQNSLADIIGMMKQNSGEIHGKSAELSRIAEEISKLSDNITQAISEIAAGTNDQSNELVDITEVLGAFNEKLNLMSEEINICDQISRKIESMANQSSEEMEGMNTSVSKVSKEFKEFHLKINELGKSINEINEITNLITEVADQTNLLALNASIEAARAGDAGKGFAVVASEISNLADQSKNSSTSIQTLIDGIAQTTSSIVKDAGSMDLDINSQMNTIVNSIESFQSIIQEMGEVIPKIGKVKESTIEIDANKNVIMSKIDQLSAASEEISASTEEILASAEELNGSISLVAESASSLDEMTGDMTEQAGLFKL